MRFNKISISNYRQYKKLILDFPKNKSTDINVIIASNGVGKTNLLNAIEWCMYDEEPHLGGNGSEDSLPICNLEAINEHKAAGKDTATVTVKIEAEEGDAKYVFERTVKVSTSSKMPGPSKFQVTKIPITGSSEIKVDAEADDIVDEFLPKKIRQYFFFDGEQLFNYFGAEKDTSHVKDSIHAISQINVVEGVKKRLNDFISEKSKELSKLNPQTAKYQEELDGYVKDKDSLIQTINKLESTNDDAQERITDLTNKINGLEHIVEDSKTYDKILKDIEGLETKRDELDASLSTLVRKYMVSLMLYNTNESTSAYIDAKESGGHLPPDIDRDLLIKSMKSKKCIVCNHDFDDDIEKHVQELINKFSVSSSVSNKLMEIKNDISRSNCDAKEYRDDKKKIFEERRRIDSDIEQLKETSAELYKKISTCSTTEDISDWMAERKGLRELIDNNNQKIGSNRNQITVLEDKIKLKETQLSKATEGEKTAESYKSEISYAKRCLAVVADIANEMSVEIRQKMETETYELFNALIWKNNTYANITLNDDYKLKLIHHNGDSCLRSCSAAERELLALAFTLALHKVSQHDSLLYIDTPVGRVSDDNRERFAKSLVDVSKTKQLILAFTPSEYSSEISTYFDNNASSINKLEGSSETSTIVKGGK